MRRVEITENEEICTDETKEATLVRNLQECVSIFNNINTELENLKVLVLYDMIIKDDTTGMQKNLLLNIKFASKTETINYVSK